MVRMSERGEIEAVLKKLELGFGLEDREIWICKEFFGGDDMEEYPEKIRKIFESLDENEQFSLSFGMFSLRISKYGLTNTDFVDLIRIRQRTTGVRF